MIILFFLLTLLTLINTALLLAICAVISRFIGTVQDNTNKKSKSFVPDTPIPRPFNYSDLIPAPRDQNLKIIKDD
jgi:hypothetical protein